MMSIARVLTILVVLTLHLSLTQAIVQFSFNKAHLDISEDENLPNQLSILKMGQMDMDVNITFQVRVMPGTAMEGSDYISNSGKPYVFTRNTTNLQIKTQLIQDRAGESIENFIICLPEAQVLQQKGAEAVEPTCVTITIVDDDSVVIGFKNTIETIMEGRTTSVCAEVKPDGLRLDPFDRVPVPIRTSPAGSEVVLTTNSLLFERTNEQCVTVSVGDSDTMGSRSYQLVLEQPSTGLSSVPVLVYPNTTRIIVIDDDGLDTRFSINSSQQINRVQEGKRLDNIRVLKLNNTALSYNVSLMVTALTSSESLEALIITNSLVFNPSITQLSVGVIEIMEDPLMEERKEFNISISGIEAIEAPHQTNLATVLGDPIQIIVYDNDFEIGFTENSTDISLPEGSSKDICVAILKPETKSDIYPMQAIPITTLSNDLMLDRRDILLNATNNQVCYTVTHNADSGNCDGPRSYHIQLTWSDDPNYSVHFRHQNATVTVIDDSQDCGLSSGVIAAICIVIIMVLAAVLGITVFVLIFMKRKNSRIRKQPHMTLTLSSTPSKNEAQGDQDPETDTDENENRADQPFNHPQPSKTASDSIQKELDSKAENQIESQMEQLQNQGGSKSLTESLSKTELDNMTQNPAYVTRDPYSSKATDENII